MTGSVPSDAPRSGTGARVIEACYDPVVAPLRVTLRPSAFGPDPGVEPTEAGDQTGRLAP